MLEAIRVVLEKELDVGIRESTAEEEKCMGGNQSFKQ